MTRRKIGNWLMAGGLLLIAAALALTLYNLWDEKRAGNAVQEIMARMPEGSAAQDGAGAGDGAQIGRDTLVIPDYQLNPDMEMPVIEIDGNEYIGSLAVPALGLTLPVMSGWSMGKLKLSPCRYSGSAYKKNLVIAGHNYRKHFSGLKSLPVGEQIVFTDMAGNIFSYRVEKTEVLNPDEVRKMTDSGWDLSLFTCTYGGGARYTLRCRLTVQ